VGALCARTAVMGAFLNVKVNASGLKDKIFVEDILKQGSGIEEGAKILEAELLAIVNSKIN
jgi:glutamate formiminotransferase/formiminotetrahydrofolate cyclodeaminase